MYFCSEPKQKKGAWISVLSAQVAGILSLSSCSVSCPAPAALLSPAPALPFPPRRRREMRVLRTSTLPPYSVG